MRSGKMRPWDVVETLSWQHFHSWVESEMNETFFTSEHPRLTKHFVRTIDSLAPE
ncbi:uncharacterized protein PHALS_14461 [Plasmopara halstedii]|uniref:Uncharacterized protein n=1 Tax=Plasmopara halstedii TaxID=4781 RepID=A0A0N7L6G4_PLAHL|nr:uncharacterized protein PHALS_14461 [Plasmopara halstedii]CEG44203.1 hypothetical protein PHALS_14461 [Plasmopara halstedii]|eukprot:XP_024580572.1 hypothetical protein PHALS_14461 [Plasmopara halstedii]